MLAIRTVGSASLSASLIVPSLSEGWHLIDVTVDPDGLIGEIDEENNSVHLEIYVYPHVLGFPADVGGNVSAGWLA